MIDRNYFQVGGTLGFNNSSYVVRKADRQLLNYLLEKNFCFVLNSRQMGKSSLMVKTADKLRAKNVSCAFSDLSVLGIAEVSSEQWYKSFAYQLLESLDLDDIDLDSWWEEHNSLTAANCLEKFFEKIILTELSNDIVIFIDEIDSVIKLSFKDDFFALIRGFYNKRTIDRKYDRLTFCLLGVATPSDLIENKVRTPFNIGYPVKLSGFTLEEAKNALIPGLPDFIEQPLDVLKQVLQWTGGQPFLTQKLCWLISQHSDSNTLNVEKIVRQYMIDDWESQDYPQHFKTISDRIFFNSNYTLELLDLYKKILQENNVTANDSFAHSQLKISGLVNRKGNYLTVYNPIYKEIFNIDWIEEKLKNIRPYSWQINKWINSNCSNEHLLKENELIEALEWSKNKNIASEDHKYLSASRVYEIQQKSKKELFIAEQELSIARQKKDDTIAHAKKVFTTIMCMTGVMTVAFILGTLNFAKNLSISQLEKNANIALQEFEQGKQIEGLSKAIAINQQLKNANKKKKKLVDYSTIKPLVAINNILKQIQVENAIKVTDNVIKNIEYNKNGQLVIFDEEGQVILWDYDTRKIIDSGLSKEKITYIAVSDDREVYVIKEKENSKTIVIDREKNYSQSFKADSFITSVAVNNNGEYIAFGNESGELTLSTKEGKTINKWSAHKGIINTIAISPDNNSIATAGYDNTIKLWSKEGVLINTLNTNGIESTLVHSIIFSPDGKTIATAGNDSTINLWNIDGSYRESLSAHTDVINSIAFSPNGEVIISASSDDTIKLWNIDGSLKQTIIGKQNNINSVAFHPDGKNFASANNKGIIEIWQDYQFQKQIDKGVFLNNKKQILSYSYQGLEIQNTSGKTISKIPEINNKLKNKLINSIAISSDENTVFIGTIDGLVASFDLHQPKLQQVFEDRYQGKVIAIDTHPTAEKLITLGINEIDKQTQYVIKEWNTDGSLIKTFEPDNQQEITAIKYNYNGEIAIANSLGNIELWNDYKTEVKSIVDSAQNDNQEYITSIAFSSDNQLIATANQKGEIKLRKNNGELLATFTAKQEQTIVYLDFSADNKIIKAIDIYGNVSDWYLDISTAIDRGCSRLQDYLITEEENTELSKICTF